MTLSVITYSLPLSLSSSSSPPSRLFLNSSRLWMKRKRWKRRCLLRDRSRYLS